MKKKKKKKNMLDITHIFISTKNPNQLQFIILYYIYTTVMYIIMIYITCLYSNKTQTPFFQTIYKLICFNNSICSHISYSSVYLIKLTSHQ